MKVVANSKCMWLMVSFSLSLPCTANTISGQVVAVANGDTLTILSSDMQQHRVRISGIYAPGKKQPYENRARQNLQQMAKYQEARAECHKEDRYGRHVCKVWVQPASCPDCGKTLDVGYAQISAGLAWWYRAYAKEQSQEDRGRYESEENEARLRKRGLWSDALPTPPWEWCRKRTSRND